MIEVRSLLLLFGIVWMIALWTYTSPLPLRGYLTNLFLPRRIITTLVVILFLLQIFGALRFPSAPLNHPFVTYAGMLFFVVGISLASWAKFVMKHNWGEPGQHDRTRQNTLVITGPFSLTRNPIYVGLLLLFIGFELSFDSWLVIGFFPILYFISQAVKKEEKLLETYFGKEYEDYKKRTPRFLGRTLFFRAQSSESAKGVSTEKYG